jgi:leucyl aminopeptidase
MSASERTSGRCAGEVRRRVALVGKGLTFDSGGYNLKVGGMIEMMKFDCGGAAAVLGAAEALHPAARRGGARAPPTCGCKQ